MADGRGPVPAPFQPADMASKRVRAIGGRLRGAAALSLLMVGLLLLAHGVVTLAWQEPLSALSAGKEQSELNERLRRIESAALAAPTGYVAHERGGRSVALARSYRRRAARGAPLGRIEIPRLGERFVFVSGVSGKELKKGPGHYSTTALPGEHGTVGIAGHRTTYAAPFRHIDDLRAGDRISIRMPYGRFTYTVEGSIVVSPTNTESLRRVRHDRIALTTCHPPFSDAKRLVVTARLRSASFADARSGGLRIRQPR
jgi:sortase A